ATEGAPTWEACGEAERRRNAQPASAAHRPTTARGIAVQPVSATPSLERAGAVRLRSVPARRRYARAGQRRGGAATSAGPRAELKIEYRGGKRQAGTAFPA